MCRQHKHNALSSAPGDLGPETLGRINQTSSRLLRPVLRDEGTGRVNNMKTSHPGIMYHSVQSDSTAYFQPHPLHSATFSPPRGLWNGAFQMRSCIAEVVMHWCYVATE